MFFDFETLKMQQKKEIFIIAQMAVRLADTIRYSGAYVVKCNLCQKLLF